MHPEPELLLSRGRDARALLENPAFLSAVDDLSHQHLAAIVAAPPGEGGREARDYHHLLHYALGELVATLTGRVETAEEIERQLLLAEDEDSDL